MPKPRRPRRNRNPVDDALRCYILSTFNRLGPLRGSAYITGLVEQACRKLEADEIQEDAPCEPHGILDAEIRPGTGAVSRPARRVSLGQLGDEVCQLSLPLGLVKIGGR